MTKNEAILAMQDGEKVSHRYFGNKEWMTMEGNMIIFEDGCQLWANEFWADRSISGWEDGFEIYQEEE